MLWKSVKCDCCVFGCSDRPYPDIVSTNKKYFCVASILKTTFAKQNIYFIEYRINYES